MEMLLQGEWSCEHPLASEQSLGGQQSEVRNSSSWVWPFGREADGSLLVRGQIGQPGLHSETVQKERKEN